MTRETPAISTLPKAYRSSDARKIVSTISLPWHSRVSSITTKQNISSQSLKIDKYSYGRLIPLTVQLYKIGITNPVNIMSEKPPNTILEKLDKLPNDLGSCYSHIHELFARLAELEKQLSNRNRNAFGTKSAKVNSAFLTGTGKAIHEQTTSELDTEKNRLNIVEEMKTGGGRSAPTSSTTSRNKEHRIDETEIPARAAENRVRS